MPQFIIDSREQKPYKLNGAVIRKLEVGDYSIEGFETCISIERKGFDDLYNCLGNKLKFFVGQLRRLGKYPFRALFLDTSIQAVKMGSYYSLLSGDEALGRLIRLSVQYDIPIYWVGSEGASLAGLWLAAVYKFASKAKKEKVLV